MYRTNNICIALTATLALAATSPAAVTSQDECTSSIGPVRFSGLIGSGDTLPPLTEVEAIDAGHAHSVALLKDGTLALWGNNAFGQLTPPEGVGVGAQRVAQVSAGLMRNVALLVDGTVVCWGANDQGQCDVPEELTQPNPENPLFPDFLESG